MSKKPIKLTDTAVKALKPETKMFEVKDLMTTNLRLRVSPTGTKSFRFVYSFNKKSSAITLGQFPFKTVYDAQIEAHGYNKMLQDGIDPKHPEDANEVDDEIRTYVTTVGELFDWYLNIQLAGKEDARINAELMFRHIQKFRTTPVDEFEPEPLVEFLKKNLLGKNGILDQMRLYVNAAFKQGVDYKKISPLCTSPFRQINLNAQLGVPLKRHRRKYAVALDTDEIQSLFKAFHHVYTNYTYNSGLPHPIMVLAVELCCVSGARKGEIQDLRFDEIESDGVGYIIRKTEHKTKNKTGQDRIIRLNSAALDVIKRAKTTAEKYNLDNSTYVFPTASTNGMNRGGHIKAIQNIMPKINELAGVSQKMVTHSMRSIFINTALDAGIPVEIVAQNVGHSNINTTIQHYIKHKEKDLHAANTRVGDVFLAAWDAIKENPTTN